MADTMIARTVDGGRPFETSGVAARDKAGQPTFLMLSGRVSLTTAGDETLVQLRNGGLELRRPGEKWSRGFGGDVSLREGQRVVVGKTAVEGSDNALFLVLTARVVD